jgi:hypothetical protein
MQPWTGCEGSRRLRHQEFLDRQHMKMTRLLSALRPLPLLPSMYYSWDSFLLQAEPTPEPLNIAGIQLVQSQFIGRRLCVERPVNFCSIPEVGKFPLCTVLLPTVGFILSKRYRAMFLWSKAAGT